MSRRAVIPVTALAALLILAVSSAPSQAQTDPTDQPKEEKPTPLLPRPAMAPT